MDKMDKAEYWILESAVHSVSPINVLASEDSITNWFFYPGPGLSRPDMINVLHRLFEAGDLIATRTNWNGTIKYEQLVPTKEEIEAALSQERYVNYSCTESSPSWKNMTQEAIEAVWAQERGLDYGLTVQGGSRWETITQADWSHYLRVGSQGKHTRVKSGEETLEEQPVDLSENAVALEWYVIVEGSDKKLIEESVAACAEAQGFSIIMPVWEVMQPWRVNYWKTLPIGYQVTYLHQYSRSKPMRPYEPYGYDPWPSYLPWYVKPQFE